MAGIKINGTNLNELAEIPRSSLSDPMQGNPMRIRVAGLSLRYEKSDHGLKFNPRIKINGTTVYLAPEGCRPRYRGPMSKTVTSGSADFTLVDNRLYVNSVRVYPMPIKYVYVLLVGGGGGGGGSSARISGGGGGGGGAIFALVPVNQLVGKRVYVGAGGSGGTNGMGDSSKSGGTGGKTYVAGNVVYANGGNGGGPAANGGAALGGSGGTTGRSSAATSISSLSGGAGGSKNNPGASREWNVTINLYGDSLAYIRAGGTGSDSGGGGGASAMGAGGKGGYLENGGAGKGYGGGGGGAGAAALAGKTGGNGAHGIFTICY